MKNMKIIGSVGFAATLLATTACGEEPASFYETYESPAPSSQSPAPVADDADIESIEANEIEEADDVANEVTENEQTESSGLNDFADDLASEFDADALLEDIFGGSDDSEGDAESPENLGAEDQWIEYDRSEFPHWTDIDGSGCDARNETLARDLTTFDSDGCEVSEGVLDDPFTGEIIYFERGGDYENGVDIDHIVPLEYAATNGNAMHWTEEQREQFANDPANLLAVDPSSNRAKSSSGPGEWMPDNEAFHCEYVTMFADVASDYDISLDDADTAKMEEVC